MQNLNFKTHWLFRSTNHGLKSANNSQLPNEDVDLDISQSNSSDLELSSCSTTASSDVVRLFYLLHFLLFLP